MFERFSHVMLYVLNLNRALGWYEETLGFTRRYVAPDAYASLWHEGMQCRLDLHPTTKESEVGHGPLPWFVARDLDATLEELRSRGVRVTEPQSEGGPVRFAQFFDCEGNELGIEELPASVAST